MAGAGYKLFNTGDVLTAAQVNTYLMEQTVMVFANAAARTTALSGVVSEGMISYLKDTNAVEVYDGSNWVSSDDPNAIQNTIVDAKGDLITATAADTPARLAVGSNGDTLVADSAATTGLRWQGSIAAGKNALINGGMDIWQRGTSFTVASATKTFTADRWIGYRGATGLTVSRQTASLDGFTYSLRVQRDSGNTSTTSIFLGQNVEILQSTPFIGKTVTVSFWARAGANYSSASNNLTLSSFSGTNATDQDGFMAGYTGSTAIVDGGQTLTTSWQRFSRTGTVSSSATQFYVSFAFTPTGTAGANDWFEVTGVQVEIGSAATNFSRAGGTIQGELAACQRYYWRSTAESSYSRFTEFNSPQSATAMFLTLRNPVRMRVKASSIDYSSLLGYDGSNLLNAVTALTIGGDSTNDWTNLTVTSTGMTQYRPTQLIANNSSSAYLGLSAEL
jgi:hypothetical protein